MKILHTSDWHLGKSIHGQDLLEDQRHVLEQIMTELEDGYDALLISGDIYDRAVPPSEAVDLFSRFIEKMVELEITTVIIPGNHDSASRLDFASGVLEKSGIHFRCRLERITEPVLVEDHDENAVHVYALPFVDEVHAKTMYPDEGIRTHQDATGFLINRIREVRDPTVPSILMAHAYTGKEPLRSESERELLIGNQGLVDIEEFSGFDYVALGHLHRPQGASRSNRVSYSGSLIPYSFSESDHVKCSYVLELENNDFRTRELCHDLKRGFSRLSGELDELLGSNGFQQIREDYLSITLTDAGYLMDIHRKLRERYPNVLEIDQPALHIETGTGSGISREQADDPRELFSLFLSRFGWNDENEREIAMDLFERIRKDLDRGEREVSG
jgi:exonuclease SbcD